jgi:hypothetical protein
MDLKPFAKKPEEWGPEAFFTLDIKLLDASIGI